MALASTTRLRGVAVALATATFLCHFALAADNFTSVADALPFLSDQALLRRPGSHSGQQNFTYCCMLAMSKSLTVQNGRLVRLPDAPARFLVDPNELPGLQFPCGAKYDGSGTGAPDVFTTLGWCRANCGGWQKSDTTQLNQWAQPLVGFILPALVFCLTVPRRRKLTPPDALFSMNLGRTEDLWKVISLFPAAIIVAIDTVTWLGLMFAMSGPILLSGLFEAALDMRVLQYIQNSFEYDTGVRVTLETYALLLFAVLAGNLDLDPAYETAERLAAAARENDGASRAEQMSRIRVLEKKLSALLDSQSSFGTAVGAPVVFYTGSFLYSIFDVLSAKGNVDTSNAIAFGMWWMVCPIIAILSGCLLAANNPSTFLGIAAGDEAAKKKRTEHEFKLRFWEKWTKNDSQNSRRQSGVSTVVTEIHTHEQPHASDGRGEEPRGMGIIRVATTWDPFPVVHAEHYYPAWIWDRGRSKQKWVIKVLEGKGLFTCVEKESRSEQKGNQAAVPREEKVTGAKKQYKINTGSLGTVTVLTLATVLVPCLLGWLTAFYTPKEGVGCRSLTIVVFYCSQVILTLLWALRFRIDNPSQWLGILWWLCFLPAASVAVFSAVGGTLMQLIGAYRNCTCLVSVSDWHRRTSEVRLSTNNMEHIMRAKQFWLSDGTAATVVLVFLAYLGWWYQRNLRKNCKHSIRSILQKYEDRYPARDSISRQDLDIQSIGQAVVAPNIEAVASGLRVQDV